MTTTIPQGTDTKLIERRTAFADGLRQLATLVEQIDDEALLDDFRYPLTYANMPVDSKEAIAGHIRAALATGAKVTKNVTDSHAGAYLAFGPVRIHVYGAREKVCERIVTGTREVTEEVPDPEALAAVPKVTVTQTVEDVEWRCTPLLAEAVS